MDTAHASPAPIVDVPRCPRCAYDQRGSVATWTDACPVEGTCPECGYEFVWTDVMRPERHCCPGHFEHVRGPLRSFRAAWRTLLWTVAPWLFWSRVQMHHEIRVRRVLLWPVVTGGSVWLAIVAFRAAAFFLEGQQFGLPASGIAAEMINAAVFPVALVYSVRWAGLMPVLDFEWVLDDWSPMYAGVLAQGVCLPLLLLMLPVTRRRAKIRPAHVLRAAVYGQAWVVFHLGLLLMNAIYGAARTDFSIALGWSGPVLDMLEAFRLIYAMGLAAWIAAWWWCAMHLGFRMPNATRHWAVLMIAALLCLAIGVVSDWRFSMYWLV